MSIPAIASVTIAHHVKRGGKMEGKKQIRLQCGACDRSDFDGCTLRDARKAGWTKVMKVEDEPNDGYHNIIWGTHMGHCPECTLENEQ